MAARDRNATVAAPFRVRTCAAGLGTSVRYNHKLSWYFDNDDQNPAID
jgi:hypothetical protein